MARLVLTRKVGEKVNVGPDVTIQVTEISRGRVRLVFLAPPEVRIFRDEIDPRRPPDDRPPSHGAHPRG